MGGQKLRRTRGFISFSGMNDAAGSGQSGQNKRGLVPKARSCKPSFLFQRKIVIKAAQRLQQVLRQRIQCLTVRYELPRSSLFFRFDDGRNEESDTMRRIYIYSSMKLLKLTNIDRFHSVKFFHLRRVKYHFLFII